MTMAPEHRRRGYWLELLFISILLFLLMGARADRTHKAAVPHLPNPGGGMNGFIPGSLTPLILQ